MQIIGQLQGLPLVTAAALATVILNAMMILLTVGVRTGRSLRQSWEERYASRTEPHLDDFLATGQIPTEVRRWRPWHRDLLAALIIARIAQVRGAERDRLRHLAGELGLTDAYLELLEAPRRWHRAQAAENLGYFGGPAAVGALTRLLSDGDETVRAVAARALARIGTPEGANALARALDDPSELTSLRVAENLERLGVPAIGPLIAALGGRNSRGPVLAARILGNLRAAEAREALLAAARSGQDEDLRAQATRALGKIGDPDDLPAILHSSRDSAWPVRAQAANALGLIGELSTVPALKKMAMDREWWVRANATSTLARMGPAGERALLELLT
nr:HEAT repeat domain-containing protein [Chloroflexota bacterium]